MSLHRKDFFGLRDLTAEDIRYILTTAETMKYILNQKNKKSIRAGLLFAEMRLD